MERPVRLHLPEQAQDPPPGNGPCPTSVFPVPRPGADRLPVVAPWLDLPVLVFATRAPPVGGLRVRGFVFAPDPVTFLSFFIAHSRSRDAAVP
jgi:hypothetical protein